MKDEIIEAIDRHAEREFPNECCGLVIQAGSSLSYVECVNTSHDPSNSFLIDPVVYARFGEKIKYIVHSHPNRSPDPSDADKASCERCNVPFLIYSYPSREIGSYHPSGYKVPLEGRKFVYSIMDCFSMVRDFYRDELGIDIKDRVRRPFGWWNEANASGYLIGDCSKWGFHKVGSPKHGDVIVMQLQGNAPNHFAIYLEGGLILHHTMNNVSKREIYGSYWRKNTICVLRHSEMINE